MLHALQQQHDGDAAKDAREHLDELFALTEELTPLCECVGSDEPGEVEVGHEREPRLQAVQPDEGQVPADHWEGQVLDELREVELAGDDQRHAECRGGERE